MNQKDATALVTGKHSGLEPTYFKIWMPYLYHRVDHPKLSNVFLPLNRNYKPLGSLTPEFVRYEDYAESHGVHFARDPVAFKDIWWRSQGAHFWLYDDTPESRTEYFHRLERLMVKCPTMLDERMV